MKILVLITGFPGSGKSTEAKRWENNRGYLHLNRDMFDAPGKVCSSEKFHSEFLELFMQDGKQKIVVDNTYPTIASRKLAVDLAKKYGYMIDCYVMQTTLEETQYNVCKRMVERYGNLVEKKHSYKTENDSNIFPPSVLFMYDKKREEPTIKEGFGKVEKVKFVRKIDETYNGKALILDYDGTLRLTKSGAKFPTNPSDIKILPGRRDKILEYIAKGYLILGVSNQSGIAKGQLTNEMAKRCFTQTNDMLGIDIDVKWCGHSIPPVMCYCRKPGPGLGVEFIEEYKLNPADCIMVGDMTSDKTFAKRCGFKYIDAHKFFEK